MNSNEKILKMLESDYDWKLGNVSDEIRAVRQMLMENIVEEQMIKSGMTTTKKKKISIVNRMIQAAGKTDERFGKVFKKDNNYFYLDGHYIVLMHEELWTKDFEIEEDSHYVLNISKCLQDEVKTAHESKIDVAKLSAICKTVSKNTPHAVFIIDGDDVVGVNPFYLLDMVKLTGADTIKWIDYKSPIFISGDDIKCIVLPICVGCDIERYKASEYNITAN